MSLQKENTRICCMCGSSPSKDPSITLHRFPKPGSKNALRCELWAKYCFPNEAWSLPKFQDELHSKHKMLCSKHFMSTCFIEKKLFRTAVPSVQCDKDTTISNLPDQPAIFEPVAGPSRTYPLREHNANIITPTNSGMLMCETSKQADQKSKMLIRKLKRSMNKVYRLQKTVKHLKNDAFLNVICNSKPVKEILNKKMSSTFSLLLQGELQNYKRKKAGRRWNMEAKIIALRLYKKSPTSYKLLRRMICLPAPSTLKSLLSKFKMNVGTNKTVLTVLKNTTKYFGPSERECTLLWDEMSLRKNLWYNPKVDFIEGFQDHATQGRSPQAASYALVFMVVGVRKQVKQPVAYYLSSGSVTADRLSALIKEAASSSIEHKVLKAHNENSAEVPQLM